MTADKERTGVLEECLGKSNNLANLVEYTNNSIVSKTILDKKAGTITLFAFDKGQKLSEHTAPYDATVLVLDGKARIRINNKDCEVSAGEIIIMPANVPHAVNADEKFKMLLIMIRTKNED